MNNKDYEYQICYFQASKSSWDKLNQAYELIRVNRADKTVFEQIKDTPVTPASMHDLKIVGWSVETNVISSGGFVFMDKKIIIIGSELGGYRRDAVLMHELMHAHYPFLDDTPKDDVSLAPFEDNIITERLGRIHRSNPMILRAAISAFGLTPSIYDEPSIKAFGDLFGFTKQIGELPQHQSSVI